MITRVAVLFAAVFLLSAVKVHAEDSVVSSADYGVWKVDVLADAMTDKKRYIAHTLGRPAGWIAFKCDPGLAGFYVSMSGGKYLGLGDERASVTLRIDKQPPREETWNGDKITIYTLDAAYTHEFGKTLSSGSILRARFDTYDHDTVDVEFSLDGAAKAIGEAMKGCDDPSRL